VLLPLKQNSSHSAALTQNASACRTMQFQSAGLFTLGGLGRRWVARGNATGLDQKMWRQSLFDDIALPLLSSSYVIARR
jgi:hypothetical protein